MTYATKKSRPTPKLSPTRPKTAQPKRANIKGATIQKKDNRPTAVKSTKKSAAKSLTKKKGKSGPPAKQAPPTVVFKRRRKKRAQTVTMARAAKAYNRHQRRLAGDRSVQITPEDEVLIEMYQQLEGHTIQVSRAEFIARPSKLTFEQLYRRILRAFEDHRIPEKALLFEMLRKSKTQEDWDNFIIIAKIFQNKMVVLRPDHVSLLVKLATNRNFSSQLFDEMQKSLLYLYPTRTGYHNLIVSLANNDQKEKVAKALELMTERGLQPLQNTFHELVMVSLSKKDMLDEALKYFKTSHGLGQRPQNIAAYSLGKKLATLERWNDVLEVEKIMKQSNPEKEFRKLISLIFLNAHIQSGDKEAAAKLPQQEIAKLKEDFAQLSEKDKQDFPFVAKLAESVPQLASA